nr:hypothetical protein Itr_chr15CG09840 [Ipomoea trifida]
MEAAGVDTVAVVVWATLGAPFVADQLVVIAVEGGEDAVAAAAVGEEAADAVTVAVATTDMEVAAIAAILLKKQKPMQKRMKPSLEHS